jgi:hypothetical protein
VTEPESSGWDRWKMLMRISFQTSLRWFR